MQIQTVDTPSPGPGELLVRSRYVGINASDINWTAGRYAPRLQPPFDTGLEGLGEVVKTGGDCGKFKPGDAVSYMYGGQLQLHAVCVCVCDLKCRMVKCTVKVLITAPF